MTCGRPPARTVGAAILIPLPKPPDPVRVESRLVGDQREVGGDRLGDEETVERVAVRTRETAGAQGAGQVERQDLEALVAQVAVEAAEQGLGGGQLAQPVLGRELEG